MTPGAPVEDYLSRVAAHLPRRGRAAKDVLEELRDGLHEALEQRPPPSREAALRRLMHEFGDPAVLGSALASEMRLSLARCHALALLAVLLATSASWALYQATVGVSATAAPTGRAEAVFFAAVGVLSPSIAVAQVAAALTFVAVSCPLRGLAYSLVPQALARTAMAALAVFTVAILAMAVLIAPAHRLEGAVIGSAVTAVAVASLLAARTIARHTGRARRARRLTG